jgi:hypothetical protein
MIVGPQNNIFEKKFQSLTDQLNKDAKRNKTTAVNAHMPNA